MRLFTGKYSIGFKLDSDAAIKAPAALAAGAMQMPQPIYQSVTLSPPGASQPAPAPLAAPAELHEAFFEEAFGDVPDAPPAEAPAADEPPEDPAPGPFRGFLEDCSPDRIAGWAQDTNPGAPPVRVAVMLGRITLAELVAESWRADLSAAGIGTGHHAFEFRPPFPIARDLLSAIKIIRVADKAELPRVFELVNQ